MEADHAEIGIPRINLFPISSFPEEAFVEDSQTKGERTPFFFLSDRNRCRRNSRRWRAL